MVGMVNGSNGAGPKHASGTFLFTSESVGEGHPDKIWYSLKQASDNLHCPLTVTQ